MDGQLPSADEVEELEEERRLFYVGATRARKQLEFLCYENKFGEPSDASFSFISQFLGEEPKKEPEHKAQPAKMRQPYLFLPQAGDQVYLLGPGFHKGDGGEGPLSPSQQAATGGRAAALCG